MVTQITPIRTPPTPADTPAVFEERASNVWADLYTAVPQMNAQALESNQAAADAEAAKLRSISEADLALGYKNEAANSRNLAQAAASTASGAASTAAAAQTAAEQARDEAQGYAASINPARIDAALVGMRNAIINGAMRINQRGRTISTTVGQSVTSDDPFFVDRWRASSGSGTFYGRTESDGITYIYSSGNVRQIVDGSAIHTGGIWTLSWKPLLYSEVKRSRFRVSQDNGVTWTPWSDAYTGSPVTLVARVKVIIEWEGGGDYFSCVQLEPGSVATPFEWLPDEVEAIRCAKYCQVHLMCSAGLTAGGVENAHRLSIQSMHSTPTVIATGVVNINTSNARVLAENPSTIRMTSEGVASGGYIAEVACKLLAEIA